PLSLPPPTKRPLLSANASLTGKEESTVTTLPLTKTHSAGGRGSKNDCGTSSPRFINDARSKAERIHKKSSLARLFTKMGLALRESGHPFSIMGKSNHSQGNQSRCCSIYSAVR